MLSCFLINEASCAPLSVFQASFVLLQVKTREPALLLVVVLLLLFFYIFGEPMHPYQTLVQSAQWHKNTPQKTSMAGKRESNVKLQNRKYIMKRKSL